MKKKTRHKAAAALNYDLFQPETLVRPAPATLYTKILHDTLRIQAVILPEPLTPPTPDLPTLAELHRMFDELNWLYFNGKLPAVTIKYSLRMLSAGSYTPKAKLIKISKRYHEIFPHELVDTLKHEMIHILHFYHDADFKREAARIGASLKATHHPLLHRPPKYIYVCPSCHKEYPRRRRLRMHSCGACSGGRFNSRFKLQVKKK